MSCRKSSSQMKVRRSKFNISNNKNSNFRTKSSEWLWLDSLRPSFRTPRAATPTKLSIHSSNGTPRTTRARCEAPQDRESTGCPRIVVVFSSSRGSLRSGGKTSRSRTTCSGSRKTTRGSKSRSANRRNSRTSEPSQSASAPPYRLA